MSERARTHPWRMRFHSVLSARVLWIRATSSSDRFLYLIMGLRHKSRKYAGPFTFRRVRNHAMREVRAFTSGSSALAPSVFVRLTTYTHTHTHTRTHADHSTYNPDEHEVQCSAVKGSEGCLTRASSDCWRCTSSPSWRRACSASCSCRTSAFSFAMLRAYTISR